MESQIPLDHLETILTTPPYNTMPFIRKDYFPQGDIGTQGEVLILNGFVNNRSKDTPCPLHFFKSDEQDKLGIPKYSIDWTEHAFNNYKDGVDNRYIICVNVSLEKGNQNSNLSFLNEFLRKNYCIDFTYSSPLFHPTFIEDFLSLMNYYSSQRAYICLNIKWNITGFSSQTYALAQWLDSSVSSYRWVYDWTRIDDIFYSMAIKRRRIHNPSEESDGKKFKT